MNDQLSTPDTFLTVDQAAALLGVKRQTLYAYVSRGLLHPAPSNGGRASLYARADLLRLKARSDARSGHGPVAAAALRWGEPVLETAVSTIDGRGPVYRGVPALDLVQRGVRFEAAAELLWGNAPELSASWRAPEASGAAPETKRATAETGRSALETKRAAPEARHPALDTSWPAPSPGLPVARLAALLPDGASPIAALLVGVPAIGERDPHRHLLSGAGELAAARTLILRMAAMLALPGGRDRIAAALGETSVARAVLAAFGVRPTAAAVRAVDTALVLCADHELNPSTFAVRVAASTGADLYACVSVGLSVLSGPQHGGVSYRVEALLAEAAAAPRAADVVTARARRGEPIPGFGHTLYRAGDPRTPPLLAAAAEAAPNSEPLATMRGLLKAMAAAGHEPPTVDMGLVAVSTALGLPSGGAAALFAIGRSAGWIAHAVEQRVAGFIVRPRARYTGP